MRFTLSNEQGNDVMRLDSEAIDYLLGGLQTLKASEPGTLVTTDSISAEGVQHFILERL